MLLIEVNTKNIRDNIKYAMSYCSKNSKYMYCVVKSNAYNHGTDKVAEIAYNAGIRMFCTTELECAVKLKKDMYDLEDVLLLKNILIDIDQLDIISDNAITLSISSYWECDKLLEYVNKTYKLVNVQIECDAGLRRHGFRYDEVISVINKLIDNEFISIKGLFGHRAAIDDISEIEKILDEVEPIRERILSTKGRFYIHFDCSSLFYVDKLVNKTNSVRLGSCLYGLDDERFKVAFSLKSKIISIKKVDYGIKYSYSQEVCNRKNGMYIGVISGGYNNGIGELRNVYCHGKKYKIIDFNMEQMLVDFEGDKYQQGEEVDLINEGIEGIRIRDIAKDNSVLEKRIVTTIKDTQYIYI